MFVIIFLIILLSFLINNFIKLINKVLLINLLKYELLFIIDKIIFYNNK